MAVKLNVLFLCTGNSCRSQMAEGWGLKLNSDKYNFYSAGTLKHGLNPNAVLVMKEVGIDISTHKSKVTDELSNIKMDLVVTVCLNAHESCPIFPGGKIIHHGFDDPPFLAKDLEGDSILEVYRRVRDEIKEFVDQIDTYLEI